MFGDLNRVELLGNITSDLNMRTITNGTNVVSFGIATNRRYKQNDEWKDQTDFHNVVVWGKQAEGLSTRARKGTRLFVSGRLTTRSWDDPNTPGKKNYKTEVVADQLILIDRFEGKKESGAPSSFKGEDKPAKEEPSDEVIDPNDLPF